MFKLQKIFCRTNYLYNTIYNVSNNTSVNRAKLLDRAIKMIRDSDEDFLQFIINFSNYVIQATK